MTRVKICCIQDENELRQAVALGASALGLVSAMPSGPGPIDEAQIARLADATPPGVTSVLLTALIEPDAIAEQARRCRVQAVQLVDEVHRPDELRRLLPSTNCCRSFTSPGRSRWRRRAPRFTPTRCCSIAVCRRAASWAAPAAYTIGR